MHFFPKFGAAGEGEGGAFGGGRRDDEQANPAWSETHVIIKCTMI